MLGICKPSQRCVSACQESRKPRVRRALPEQQIPRSTDAVPNGLQPKPSRVKRQKEALRALGIGKAKYEELASTTSTVARLPAGDVDAVLRRLDSDFARGYFVTGLVDDTIYAEDCWFADPTVSFTGLQLYKRNLQLLVPFLMKPSVKLQSINRSGTDDSGRQTLRAEWVLDTVLALPWRPRIYLIGATDYTLGRDGNVIVEHVESWNVSGAQALAQMLRPGKADDS